MAYLLPLHDTRPDREAVRARMRAMAATSQDLGDLGDAIVHDALGRGYLALHAWQEANTELAAAAAAGLQTPELHAARARALGELFHETLEEAHRSGGSAWLAQRQQALVEQYLTPALAEVDRSRTWDNDANLLEAQVALYRRDFASAEKQALAVVARSPGLSDARKLAADAAYGGALAAFDHGDYDAARSGFDRAVSFYEQASDVARSDPSLYEAAAGTWLQRGEVDDRQGRSPRESIEHALDAIEHALRADPDDGPVYTTKAFVLLLGWRTPALQASDQRAQLDSVAQAATHAVEIDRRNVQAWDALGYAHVQRGGYEETHGEDGTPWWNRALDEFDAALAIQPQAPQTHNERGTAHKCIGDSLGQTGHDPLPEYQAALHNYEFALTLYPHYVNACANQVELHASIAEYEDAIDGDPQPAADNARRIGEHCLEIDPNYYQPLDSMARAQLALAHHISEIGGDPTSALANTHRYLDRVEKLRPEHPQTWFSRLVAADTEAKFRMRQGADPTSAIAAGRAALDQMLRLIPDSDISYVEAARLGLVEAAWTARTGRNSEAVLARARADSEKAIAINHKRADAQLVAAEVCLQIATAQPSRAVVDAGVAYVDQALALNPRLHAAQTVRSALLRLTSP